MWFAARRGAGVSAPGGDYGCVPLPITRETWNRLCPRPYARLLPFPGPPARRVSRPHTSSKLATPSGALRVDERCAGVLRRDGSSNTSQYAVLHVEWQTGIHASNRRAESGQGRWMVMGRARRRGTSFVCSTRHVPAHTTVCSVASVVVRERFLPIRP